MNAENVTNATPAPPALVAAEDALMAAPDRPTKYTIVPSALNEGVLSRADITEATRAAHAAGLSNGDFQALQLAAIAGKAESDRGRPEQMQRNRMYQSLSSRHGAGGGNLMTKAMSAAHPLRASKPLAAMLDYALRNRSFVERLAARADYAARKASRKGG